MLAWPAVQRLLLNASPTNLTELEGLKQEGSAFLIVRLQKAAPNLPQFRIILSSVYNRKPPEPVEHRGLVLTN